jgi:hypothetical protein
MYKTMCFRGTKKVSGHVSKTHTIIHDLSLSLSPYNTYYYTLPLTVFVPLQHILLYMTAHCLCTPKAHTIIHDRSLSL